MSAWDVAGAVVWTALTAFWALATLIARANHPDDDDTTRVGFVLTVLSLAAAVYCIARLCGAHA